MLEAIRIMNLGPMLLSSLIAALCIVSVTGICIVAVGKVLEKAGIVPKNKEIENGRY